MLWVFMIRTMVNYLLLKPMLRRIKSPCMTEGRRQKIEGRWFMAYRINLDVSVQTPTAGGV